MNNKPKLFWDSSALIAAVMSPDDSSIARQLLQLGEADTVDMRASREVLRDVEIIVRKRKASLIPQLAQMLDLSNIVITLDPNQETIDACIEMTGYLPDARVLAAAVECDADLFLTYDTEHFLQNPLIGPPDTRLRVVTPKQAMDWCRAYFEAQSQDEE